MHMDRNRLVELALHYVVLLGLVLVTLTVVETLVGRLGFWVELAVIFAVVLAYRPAVRYLGVAPSAWEE